MALFRFLWRTLNFIRNLVMNVVFLIFVLFVMALVGSIDQLTRYFKDDSKTPTVEKGALYVKLNGRLQDNRSNDDQVIQAINSALSDHEIPTPISTFDVVETIYRAKFDPNITGLVLDLNTFKGADFPAIHYLGAALNDFKQSKKPVIAYAENYDQKGYLLASYADKIFLNPMGQVDISGLSVDSLYYKKLLDDLKVQPHVFRVGTYKSAVEPFLRNEMSPEAKSNLQRWLGVSWQDYLNVVAKNRNIKNETIAQSATDYLQALKQLNGDMTAYAKQRNLVTDLATPLAFKTYLKDTFGFYKKPNSNGTKPNTIDWQDYHEKLNDRTDLPAKGKAYIAVVNVEGEIVDGASGDNTAGGDTIARYLRRVYEDPNAKGLILRVNSPGGSAFASELIRQSLEQIQQAGKPVVVSMGGTAASGGYWISAGANYIVADPDTITGSIGIFGLLPTFEKSLQAVGVTPQQVATTAQAQGSTLNGLPAINGEIIQQQINHGYDRFITIVSQGRKMSKADVDKIAQGQVWIGRDALKHHLVDELGDFDVAVKKVKALVQAKDEKSNEPSDDKKLPVRWMTDNEGSVFSRLMKDLNGKTQSSIKAQLNQMLPAGYQAGLQELSRWQKMRDPHGQYLYCLGCANIK